VHADGLILILSHVCISLSEIDCFFPASFFEEADFPFEANGDLTKSVVQGHFFTDE
jgi:hypothetical protein